MLIDFIFKILIIVLILTQRYVFIDFREKGREVDREREKHRCERGSLTSCLLHKPQLETKHTTPHVPWPGIEPATFWFMAGRGCYNQLSHLARAVHWFERERERKRERDIDLHEKETLIGCLLYAPWSGIELVAFWCTGWFPTNWATWPGQEYLKDCENIQFLTR